jgi:hypothetical protein
VSARTVTFCLLKSDGATPMVGALIKVQPTGPSYSANAQYPGTQLVGKAGADGTGEGEGGIPLVLWANESESEQSVGYRAEYPNHEITTEFSVPAGTGPISLSELLAAHGQASVEQFATLGALLAAESAARLAGPPHKTTAERDAIVAPTEGMQVYNTTTHKLNIRGAAAWEEVTSI